MYDFDPATFEDIQHAVKDVPLPCTANGKTVEDHGMIEIPEDIIVFARNKLVQPIDRTRDIPVMIVMNHNIPHSPVHSSVEGLVAREVDILGHPDTRNSSVKDGVLYEQRMFSAGQGPRTYQQGITFELATQVAHPSANAKDNSVAPEKVVLVKALNEVRDITHSYISCLG